MNAKARKVSSTPSLSEVRRFWSFAASLNPRMLIPAKAATIAIASRVRTLSRMSDQSASVLQFLKGKRFAKLPLACTMFRLIGVIAGVRLHTGIAFAFDRIPQVKHLKPNVVVLDLVPVENGLNTAQAISMLSPNSAMVLFTAHANNQLAEKSKRVGVRAVIPKAGNASLDQLVSVLRVVSKSRRAA